MTRQGRKGQQGKDSEERMVRIPDMLKKAQFLQGRYNDKYLVIYLLFIKLFPILV